ncbi:MAG: T9SS type A sorting domain-containing protein [Bacteroidota bacterium]
MIISKLNVAYILLLSFLAVKVQAQVEVDVNLNTVHSVGTISDFDRNKFINSHGSLTESDWDGDEDKLTYLMEDVDAYLGRDNGIMPWNINQSTEDPNNPGYVDPAYMATRGQRVREVLYGINNASRHKYEDRSDIIFGGQVRPFWDGVTKPCCDDTSWSFDSDAAGDFMGRFFNEFFRNEGEPSTKGHPRPRFMEILNEPLYELSTVGDTPPLAVFEYHNEVADAIRRHNTDVLIGGYTTAFPYFDVDNFQRWDDRMKLFLDTSGEKMDFFSVHFYDFNETNPQYFRGSRMEATLDMMEHYSMIRLDTIKPFHISEYGGRNRVLEQAAWSPFRDWTTLRTISPMMLSFMDRPDKILKAIPFIVTKAEWGRQDDGDPYPWRLLRQDFEETGVGGDEWVFTELIKFYELWADVNGKRVHTNASDPDVLVDAYVDGNKAYVIVNNLITNPKTFNLNLFEDSGLVLEGIVEKALYLNGSAPILERIEHATPPAGFTLTPESTTILEYTFAGQVPLDETSEEVKYYATDYLQPINANSEINFNINGVDHSGMFGKATLRLGVGREHGKSLRPMVSINGTELSVPSNFSGDDDQQFRPGFFGLLEVDVPYELLQEDNEIAITFDDAGGFVSSAAMRVFRFSDEVEQTDASSFLSFDNYSSFLLGDQTVPEFLHNQEILMDISYSSGTIDGVERDLSSVTLAIRQLDENGLTVASSTVDTIASENAANAGVAAYTYTIPSTFADGSAIPEPTDLPDGHQLMAVIEMLVEGDERTVVTEEVLISASRDRFVTFNNRSEFIPSGGVNPEVFIGQTMNIEISYSTDVVDGVEDDLNYVATFLRQLDENGGTVKNSAFQTVVTTDAANFGTTTYSYTIPSVFTDGTVLPVTADLPEGHSYILIIFSASDGVSKFANANGEIIVKTPTAPPVPDRARSISFNNRSDFFTSCGTAPEVAPGDVIDLDLTYSTGIVGGQQEDLTYVATFIRQLNENGGLVADSPFEVILSGDAADSGSFSYTYTIPDAFADGSMIPLSSDLPDGHSYSLVIFMSVDENAGFANANDLIILNEFLDVDDDGIVDACDEDNDNDGLIDELDDCPLIPNTPISLNFAFDGSGEHCWVTEGNVDFINSWELVSLTINGVAYENRWTTELPDRIDGKYFIRYESNVDWGHFEINGTDENTNNDCEDPVEITIPFVQDGVGDYCWVTTDDIRFINSWSLDALEINGEDYTNRYSTNLPDKIDGQYVITYSTQKPWGHFEAGGFSISGRSNPSASGAISQLMIHPDPVSLTANVRWEGLQNWTDVIVYDPLGRVVMTQPLAAGQQELLLDISDARFRNGMYLISVISQGERLTKKLVITK